MLKLIHCIYIEIVCSNDMIQYHDTAGFYNHHNIVWAVDKYAVAVLTVCLLATLLQRKLRHCINGNKLLTLLKCTKLNE